jgi:hypothetical protein
MYWLACKILDKYNDDYDEQLLDRKLELHEALSDLHRHHPEVKVSNTTEEDFIEQSLKECRESEEAAIAAVEASANDIAEYEAWAEEQHRTELERINNSAG